MVLQRNWQAATTVATALGESNTLDLTESLARDIGNLMTLDKPTAMYYLLTNRQ